MQLLHSRHHLLRPSYRGRSYYPTIIIPTTTLIAAATAAPPHQHINKHRPTSKRPTTTTPRRRHYQQPNFQQHNNQSNNNLPRPWGFVTASHARTLVRDLKLLSKFIIKTPTIDHKLFANEELEKGFALAYKTVGEIFAQGEPIFESECSDIVETRLARRLDRQLIQYIAHGLEPKLEVKEVTPHLVCVLESFTEWLGLPIPAIHRSRNLFLSAIQMLYIGTQRWWQTYVIGKLTLELVAYCEFDTWEGFELVTTPSSNGTPPVVARKHVWVFTCDISSISPQLAEPLTEQYAKCQWKVKSINYY